MNAHEFYKIYGLEEARAIAASAGTNWAYFKQIVYGVRRPSVELAYTLEEVSEGRMKFRDLLPPKQRQAA